MTKFVKLFLAVLLVASCSKENDNTPNLTIVTENGPVAYVVENAQTTAELEKGLMFRESLAPDAGMIFDLSKVEQAVMWMKNTKIPLDMLFIDQDGMISWIYENAEPESTNFIIPPFPATAVVEINAGDVQKNNIKIGDIVKHKFLNNVDEDAKPVVDQETAPAVVEEVDEVVVEEGALPAASIEAPEAPVVSENESNEVPAGEEVPNPEPKAPEAMIE